MQWYRGSEAALVEALRVRALDVAVAGLHTDTPWASKVALTQPYLVARLRFGVRDGASGIETLPQEVTAFLRDLDWVDDAEVRMREDGHAFFGEAFVVPRTSEGLPQKIEHCAEAARKLDWRLHELCVMPVDRLPGR